MASGVLVCELEPDDFKEGSFNPNFTSGFTLESSPGINWDRLLISGNPKIFDMGVHNPRFTMSTMAVNTTRMLPINEPADMPPFFLAIGNLQKNSSQVQDDADDETHDERDGDNRTGQRAIAVDELSELVTLTGLVMSCQFSFPFGLVVRPLIGVAGYGTVIGILG